MKIRKVQDIGAVLSKKGFVLNPAKQHHRFYYLCVDGRKTKIYTYFSHSKNEYGKNLLSQIKKQIQIDSIDDFENFLDCPLSKEDYLNLLAKKGFDIY